MSGLWFLPVRAARWLALAALAAGIGGLGGCGSFNQATQNAAGKLTLYRPEIVQGNFVSKEQVAQLKPGMTRLQVRDLLGTPLLASVFRGDRWDYVFTMKRQGVQEQSYHLTVYFKNDLVERFEGDPMPSETEFVDRISPERKVKVPELEATEEQLAKFPPAADPLPAASAPASAPRAAGTYPPLE